ncbi:hypothetical protein [Citrobacter braakii]|uniref:hypothetical protein n=1 Tax=Citrobacter braakii TaxID=57706 RepID=UPI003D9594AF
MTSTSYRLSEFNPTQSLAALQRSYQRELNLCNVRDSATGKRLRRHRYYLQLERVNLSAATGFSSPVLFPRFLTMLNREQRWRSKPFLEATKTPPADCNDYPFLNPASPWFSLLMNECERAGSASTRQRIPLLRRVTEQHHQREQFALVYFWQLLEGIGEEDILPASINSPDKLQQWIEDTLYTSHRFENDVEEYLFFAFYHQWSTSPLQA